VSYDPVVLKTRLESEEGRKRSIYTDTTGNVSVGIGRNLTGVGVSDDEIELMLSNDVARAEAFLTANLPWWTGLDDVRQSVLMDLAFNMGAELLQFHHMLAAVQASDWNTAFSEMLNSTWATQVGRRAQNLARIMLTGSL
jgi:GH24 family phage-related lysozyme (muramidase)